MFSRLFDKMTAENQVKQNQIQKKGKSANITNLTDSIYPLTVARGEGLGSDPKPLSWVKY